MSEENTKTAKEKWLDIAEVIDAYRVIPRIILFGVMALCVYTMVWFFGLTATAVITCDPTLMKILMDSGVSLEGAKALACTTSSYVGGPTTQHVTFATAIVGGLASAVFGFYANTGRKWKKPGE
jgi:hypothetical protein